MPSCYGAVHSRGLHGKVRDAYDVAFSPDGKLVATAHAYDAGPGEVKLWDWAKGSQVATFTAREIEGSRECPSHRTASS